MGQLKDGRRGFASKQLQRINQLIQNMSSSPYIDPIKAQDEVLRNIGESNADDVVQLDSDVFYSIASYAVNNVLGGRAKEGTENDDLLVNGMARKLLYNEKGEFRLSNLDFAFDLETPLANISLAVPSVFIKGVDTFKTLVAFKSPKEENLTIVTDSDIEMGSIVVGGNFVLTLLPR